MTDSTYAVMREDMVRRQIQYPCDDRPAVTDAGVLSAMRTVPRHRFVSLDLASAAYDDRPLPIGYEQTISQPYIVAVMTELLALEPNDTVLEVGTGSGYQTSVLAQIVRRVYSMEIVGALADAARQRLTELGYDNVEVRTGNGNLGWPEHAPFDAILATAAPVDVPRALLDQLQRGGRLVLPLGPVWRTQKLIRIDKKATGETSQRQIMTVGFVPMVKENRAVTEPTGGDLG